jgi:3-hydroxy-9,10-secoandrosta-1,3,5(10)-triene-9,17-dione monooxygenase
MAESAAASRAVRGILDKVAQSDPTTAESIAVLHGSLAGQTLKPVGFGGLAKPATEFVSEVCGLAALDASLGWLAGMFNAAAHEVAMLPPQTAEAVWGSNPDALVTTSSRGEGGLAEGRRLTARWESVIGAEYADWLLLPVDNGAARVLVPRRTARIEPVRNHQGLAAAGVCDVTVSGSTVSAGQIFEGRSEKTAVIVGAGAAAAVVGSAEGVWRHHVGQVRARLATSYGGDDVSNAAAAQVAWAASDIDAAKLQVATAVGQRREDAAGTWVYQQAVARARAAADRLLGSSRHALDASDPVTRQWQDLQVGCRLAVRFLERAHGVPSSDFA